MTASLAILNQTGKQCFLKCLMNMGTLKRLENIISIFLDKLLLWHLPSVILQMLDPISISFVMACCFLLLSDTNPSKALLARLQQTLEKKSFGNTHCTRSNLRRSLQNLEYFLARCIYSETLSPCSHK